MRDFERIREIERILEDWKMDRIKNSDDACARIAGVLGWMWID